MRIISGSARGRKLKEPVGESIRPTSDKVKESIFNIIQFDIEGRRVLDLFAGTGQLGIEALSRGAANVVFIDLSKQAIELVRENLNLCGFSDLAKVYNTDALHYLSREEKFDIIFVDPPYNSFDINSVVSKIMEFDKLRENGIIICESRTDTEIETATPYVIEKRYKYGKVALTKIIRSANTIPAINPGN